MAAVAKSRLGPATSHLQRVRTTFADEDEPTPRFMAESLTADGYRVDVTQNQSRALLLRVNTPDLTVLTSTGTPSRC